MARGANERFEAGRAKPTTGFLATEQETGGVIRLDPKNPCKICNEPIGLSGAMNGSGVCPICMATEASKRMGSEATKQAEMDVKAGLLGRRIEPKSFIRPVSPPAPVPRAKAVLAAAAGAIVS